MEAVPVYSIGGTGSNNPWEIMAAMNGNRGGFGNGADMWGWLIILLLFGWGGRGGFGGGYGNGGGGCGCGCNPCCNGGFGALSADLAVSNATATARNEAGLDFIAQNVNGIRNTLCEQNVNLCNQFANVTNAINTVGYQTQLGQRDLQALFADCCCKTQSNIAASTNAITQQLCQLNYNGAMQTSEIKQAIAAEGAATRQLIQAQYTADLERKLAESKQQLFVLKNFGQYANTVPRDNACGCGCGC
ncbi:MAG: hypothetical protein J6T08_08410 [Lentisphaeria bacterium]|nr:hypothetical protein [Lentisphaeria bacterium]